MSYYHIKNVKYYKYVSIIGFVIAFFAFKYYFFDNIDKNTVFEKRMGRVVNCKLTSSSKYKYLTFQLNNDSKLNYKIIGPYLNEIVDYESLCDHIDSKEVIYFESINRNDDDFQFIYSLKSQNKIYLKLEDTLKYEENNRKAALWLGIAMLLSGLFLLSGINIIIDKSGFRIEKH